MANSRPLHIVFLLLLLVSFYSCTKAPKTLQEYKALKESKQTQTLGDLSYELYFLPQQFYKKTNKVEETDNSLLNFRLRIADGSNMEFLLSGSKEAQEYKLSYYTEAIREDIQMISGKDTIPCGMVICERYYNMRPFNDLLVSFEKKDNIEDSRILIDDKLMNTGKLAFRFEEEVLKLNNR